MEIHRINDVLAQLEMIGERRDHIITLAATLSSGWVSLMENNRPRLLDFKTLKLKEALVPAPITGQEQYTG